MPHPIPEGRRTITPHLGVKGASDAIAFYKRAFGAEELCRMPVPSADGGTKVMHAELRIGDSAFFLADEFPEFGAPVSTGVTRVTMHLCVTDADAAFSRAVDAGASVVMPLADMFWGDRYGVLEDAYGHKWAIAEHVDDPTPEQMQERMAAAFGGVPCGAS